MNAVAEWSADRVPNRVPDSTKRLAFGVRLHLGAAPYLLRTSASDMVDAHVLLDDVDPKLARRIDDLLAAAPGPRTAVAALTAELARHLDGGRAPDRPCARP